MPPPRHIRRFIILGQSRSGTQLLRELLDSHPQVCCEGELLHANLAYVGHRALLELLRIYPDPLLTRRLRKSAAPVYGFNLMFYHLRFPHFTLQRLLRDHWLLVHLVREDLLQIALSYLIAQKTGTWHRRSGESRPDYTVLVSPLELEQELAKRARWRRLETNLTADLPYLPLRYEQDLADGAAWQGTCNRVFAALGLEPQPVSSLMVRTNARPWQEIVGNYAELHAWLRGSRYRQYLEIARP